jgi:hypothetical protein
LGTILEKNLALGFFMKKRNWSFSDAEGKGIGKGGIPILREYKDDVGQ